MVERGWRKWSRKLRHKIPMRRSTLCNLITIFFMPHRVSRSTTWIKIYIARPSRVEANATSADRSSERGEAAHGAMVIVPPLVRGDLSKTLMNIQRVLAQGIRVFDAGWSNSGKMVRPICIVLLSLLLEGCTKPSVHEPVTLTLLEEWSNKTFSDARQQELQQFTRETGSRVILLPSPDSARQRLALWKELLGTAPRVL